MGQTIVRPATSIPGSGPGSQLDTTTWLMRVQASGVVVTGISFEGDNPDLGGSVDARGGIVTDFTLGTFDDHHRFLLARMLARVDGVNDDIAALDAEIEGHLAPFAEVAARLAQIPGVGPTTAAVIIAEIGVDMTRFPTPAHLASWAKFAPGVNSSAGKSKGSATGHGNRYLARALGEAAVCTNRTPTFLGARYRRRRDAARRAERRTAGDGIPA